MRTFGYNGLPLACVLIRQGQWKITELKVGLALIINQLKDSKNPLKREIKTENKLKCRHKQISCL